MSQNDGNIMQLSINANSIMSYLNESHSVKEYFFQEYDTLILPNDCHQLTPDYLVLHTINFDDNIYNTLIYLESIMKYISFNLTIDSQIIKIPLLFLIKLNKPRMFSNKLYIKIPFEILHEKKIPVIKISDRIIFKVENSQELVDNVLSYSLMCKISFYHMERQNILNNVNILSDMQNVKSYYIKNNNESIKEVDVNLHHVTGVTKGVFVECNVNSLINFKFNINGIERINYDRFQIEEYCTIINPNVIYIPISPNNISYTSFDYVGSLNMGRTRIPLIHMSFNTPQTYIGMHSLYYNKITYSNERIILQNNYNNFLSWNTCITQLALRNIESLVPLQLNPSRTIDILNDDFILVNTSSCRYILNSDGTRSNRQNILNILTGNMLDYLNNNIVRSDSSGNNIIDLSGNVLYRTDLRGNIIWVNNNMLHIVRNTFPNIINENTIFNDEIYIYRYIDSSIINSNEDYLCYISHDFIKENDKYMECTNCNKRFFELAIKQWLLMKTPDNKTCPTCRSIWTNYNIYINTSILENI